MDSQCVIQPRRLKDFLQDQNLLPYPHPRKSAISVLLHAAVKSSNLLRRRFSNKLRSTSRLPEPTMQRTTSVTVKDILRWKSFRDLADPVEVNAPPVPESPRCTSTTTSSAATPRSSCSWCDSDFTVDDSPVGYTEGAGKKSFQINIGAGERNAGDLKDRIVDVEEDDQFSPVSVLDFMQQREESFSPFHQTLGDLERRNINLKQRIQSFENLIEADDMNKHVELNDTELFKIEEHAIGLMDDVKTSFIEEWDLSLDCLLIDFFRDELMTSKEVNKNGKLESRVLSVAKSWVRGEDLMEGTREVYIQEMDRLCNWKDFEDDKKEIVIEMEKILLNHLLDELTMDLVNV